MTKRLSGAFTAVPLLALFLAQANAVPLVGSASLVKSCEACHGALGDSRKAYVPRLNGQKKGYILARFRNFLGPSRDKAHASLMTRYAPVSDNDVEMLAQYFSRQTPTPRTGLGTQADAGGEIFLHGSKPDLPACATCHGPYGDGLGGTPRIAGQQGSYLAQQLEAFKSGARGATAMDRHTWDMSLEQMQALSEYLANN